MSGTGGSVDYYDIENELAEIIRLSLPDVTVLLEEPIIFGSEFSPCVGVYLDGVEIPDQQPLAVGRVQREVMRISIWVWVFSVDIQTCIRLRNQLRRRVRDVLMLNRTVNDFVETMYEIGGDMASARVEESVGYVSGAEIALRAPIKTVA